MRRRMTGRFRRKAPRTSRRRSYRGRKRFSRGASKAPYGQAIGFRL